VEQPHEVAHHPAVVQLNEELDRVVADEWRVAEIQNHRRRV